MFNTIGNHTVNIVNDLYFLNLKPTKFQHMFKTRVSRDHFASFCISFAREILPQSVLRKMRNFCELENAKILRKNKKKIMRKFREQIKRKFREKVGIMRKNTKILRKINSFIVMVECMYCGRTDRN